MAGTTHKPPKLEKPRPKPTPKPKVKAKVKPEPIPVPIPVPKAVPKNKKYIVKIARLYHPDQKVYIDREPVELKMDSWTEVQLKAGLLIEV